MMNNTLTYKEFTARIEFDGDDGIFYGRILGIDDIIGFHGETVEELKKSMKEMIDFYLETCRQKGEKPKKNYSGKVLFRLPGELHARIAETAAAKGKSINEWGKEVFESAVK